MSPSHVQDEELVEDEQPAPKPPREPIKKTYIVALLVTVL